MSTAEIQDLKNYIDARTINRIEGSHSTFDELRFAVREAILPAVKQATDSANAATAAVNRLLYGGGRNDGSDRTADLAGQVQAIQDRVLQVGGRWDNFQDIQMRLDLILKALNVPVPGGPVLVAPTTYTVQAGETLGGIAKATGHTVDELVLWNKLADANAINVGQVLRLGP